MSPAGLATERLRELRQSLSLCGSSFLGCTMRRWRRQKVLTKPSSWPGWRIHNPRSLHPEGDT